LFFLKGLTPLHLYIIGNHVDCIRKLLNSNVNINISTHHGSLPIHFAAYLGNTDIFDLFNNQSKPSDLIETDQQGNVCVIFKI
jgi:ankyrin repeat protein